MSLYSACVLTGSDGSIHRVFLIRKDGPHEAGFDIEQMRDLRNTIVAKYGQDLLPVDLEVVEVARLKDRVKELNGATSRRRKR